MPNVALADDDVNIVQLAAQKALERSKGDVDNASALLEREAKKDQDLYDGLVSNFLGRACRDAILAVVRHAWRPASWGSDYKVNFAVMPLGKGQQAPDPKAGNIIALADLNMRNLMEFHLPIPGSPLLGSATREQVLRAAQGYLSHGRDFFRKGRWLELVAEKMPEGDKLVREVLNERKLADLRAEAEK